MTQLYTSLKPPECEGNISNFNKEGDVYFYGWLLVELILEKEIDYDLKGIYIDNFTQSPEFKSITLLSLNKVNKSSFTLCLFF